MPSLLTLSATSIAALIRNREITSEEAVEAHINYAATINPTLNAIVKERFAAARAEANQADRILSERGPENVGPLHGVPCTIKEAFAFAGMPQTSGLWHRKNYLAPEDATAVARLKQAGAIPIGITNVPEVCMWMETHNRVYGRTNNPYDPSRIVGGSSGGEGAIIGSGASPFGLGSDVGGSIRMPAFFNGVFGHKPSSRIVPNTGQYPIARGIAAHYLATGPLARRAEDLMPLLRILAGPDECDPVCEVGALGDPTTVDLSQLTIYSIEGNGAIDVHPDLLAAQRRALHYLGQHGAKTQTIRLEKLRHSLDIWAAMLSQAENPPFKQILGGEKPISVAFELMRWTLRLSPHTLPALMLALVEPIGKLTPTRTRRFIESGHELREEIQSLLGANGVLLYPSYSQPAPKHLRPLALTFHWVYTAIINVLELPATQVPLGLNQDGLPLGVQVVGNHGNDHLTIAVALALEQGFGGWSPPRLLTDYLAARTAA